MEGNVAEAEVAHQMSTISAAVLLPFRTLWDSQWNSDSQSFPYRYFQIIRLNLPRKIIVVFCITIPYQPFMIHILIRNSIPFPRPYLYRPHCKSNNNIFINHGHRSTERVTQKSHKRKDFTVSLIVLRLLYYIEVRNLRLLAS